LAVLLEEQEVRWHRSTDGKLQIMQPSADGIFRSHVFPGLWLDPAALLASNLARVLAVLQDGLNSPEHKQFVDKLAATHESKSRTVHP
jgi:hypothetical protein